MTDFIFTQIIFHS